jgi:hypothetical protein
MSEEAHELLSKMLESTAVPDPLAVPIGKATSALGRVNSGMSQSASTDATSLHALSCMARTCSHTASLRGTSTPLTISCGTTRASGRCSGTSPPSGKSSGWLPEEAEAAGRRDGLEDDEAVLMKVPVASRIVASRLIKQRRAVTERAKASGRSWGGISNHYTALQPQSENLSTVRNVLVTRNGVVPAPRLRSPSAASAQSVPKSANGAILKDAVPRAVSAVAPDLSRSCSLKGAALTCVSSVASSVSENESEASRRSLDGSCRRAAVLASSVERLNLTGLACPKGPRLAGRSRWGSTTERPAVARGTGLHASFTSPFFTADNTGFSGSLDDVVAVGDS